MMDPVVDNIDGDYVVEQESTWRLVCQSNKPIEWRLATLPKVRHERYLGLFLWIGETNTCVTIGLGECPPRHGPEGAGHDRSPAVGP